MSSGYLRSVEPVIKLTSTFSYDEIIHQTYQTTCLVPFGPVGRKKPEPRGGAMRLGLDYFTHAAPSCDEFCPRTGYLKSTTWHHRVNWTIFPARWNAARVHLVRRVDRPVQNVFRWKYRKPRSCAKRKYDQSWSRIWKILPRYRTVNTLSERLGEAPVGRTCAVSRSDVKAAKLEWFFLVGDCLLIKIPTVTHSTWDIDHTSWKPWPWAEPDQGWKDWAISTRNSWLPYILRSSQSGASCHETTWTALPKTASNWNTSVTKGEFSSHGYWCPFAESLYFRSRNQNRCTIKPYTASNFPSNRRTVKELHGTIYGRTLTLKQCAAHQAVSWGHLESNARVSTVIGTPVVTE